MIRIFGSILLAATVTFGAPSIDSLLKGLDDLYKQVSDIKAVVTLTQQKANQGAKKLEMMYYRRDSDQSFLIVITGPEAEKGNGYLRVGDNFWMYRKNTRTFQHINRDESIGGSDAHGDDFEGRLLTEMYEPARDDKGNELITEEMLGKIPVYRFEVKAKVNDVDYPKKVYWVRKDKTVMLKETSYSASGTLMQTAYFLTFTEIKKRLVPVKQLFVDEFEKGNKTIVEISGISIDKLDDQIFTKAYLENLSK
ncbi:MAG: outer membrane lipoprotein-sorting protein [Chitinispirillaceae bacterium]|nr:outer membrane lipoprotein-sorting protein [Chitinispirillaceae bacterium]